jgi:radical SAM-linked protein
MVMRIRIVFAKTEAMRYTSHLDLYRTWERTLRRAGLPMVYSQGYNPRPRIQLAAALPLGFTGQSELIDVWLADDALLLEEIQDELDRALPPGLSILEVYPVDPGEPALQTVIDQAEYEVLILDPCPDLPRRIEILMEESTLPRQRRGKEYDLRPLIEWVQVLQADDQSSQRLRMRLAAKESRTGRPDEVLFALNLNPERARIERVQLIIQGD